MGGQMSCSSPHPPSDSSDRAGPAASSSSSSSSYHKPKQKDLNHSHSHSHSHLITQRLMKLASKGSTSHILNDKQHAQTTQQQQQQQQQQPSEPSTGGGTGTETGTGTRALPLSHPALSHSSAQQAFQSHTQPAVRPQSAQPPSDPPPTTQPATHPLRSSSSYQTLGPMVYVCCASSRIGIATIRGLRLNYPSINIRAGIGMYENKSDVIRMFREAHLDDIDYIQVDPRKRQSLIWALVGVQALLVIPDVEHNVRTALAHVQAAKTAGVALVTVVTKPKPTDKSTIDNKKTDIQQQPQPQPHVVERYTLKTKLGCCFMRLPLDLVDDIVCPPPPAGTSTSLSPENNLLGGAPKFHLSDVGTACATILANHQQHVFTRYDLEVADADNKRKYQESIEQQIRQGAGTPTQIDDMSSQPSTPDSAHRMGYKSRRGSTASTITDVSDRSNSSTPDHSRNHCRHIKQRSSYHEHELQQHHRSRSNSSEEHSPHHTHSPHRQD